MNISIRNNPLIGFLIFATVLTQTSIMFPQNIGRLQQVAGWPLTMYKAEFRRVGEIEASGEIIHRTVKDKSFLMWERVLVNFLLWMVILEGTWLSYHWIVGKKPKKVFRNRNIK